MNREQAEALLVALGSTPKGHSDTWVRGPCPLAPWTHKSGKDRHPSFGLNIAQGTTGRFHCFSCESGGLSKLLQLIEWHELQSPGKFHGDLSKAREIVDQEEVDLPILPAYDEFGNGGKKIFQPFPEYFLETFPPATHWARPVEYLIQRGFPVNEVQERWDLRYDKDNDRLVFPYRDVFGRLAGLRGRGVELHGEHHWSPHHDYPWNDINNSSLTWFNEQVLDTYGPVVVVEGQFDCMRVSRVYPRVLANLTAKPVFEKVAKLTQTDGVVLMLDGDPTGRDATNKFASLLDVLKVPTAVVLLPTSDDQGHTIKTDPDKLGEAWIADALKKVGLEVDKLAGL